MSRSSTAGKGPGIVLRAQNRTGAIRVSVANHRDRAVVEMMDNSGHIVEVGLNPEELRTLSQVLRKVSLALTAETLADDITQS